MDAQYVLYHRKDHYFYLYRIFFVIFRNAARNRKPFSYNLSRENDYTKVDSRLNVHKNLHFGISGSNSYIPLEENTGCLVSFLPESETGVEEDIVFTEAQEMTGYGII
jgi:hypothetical protein